MASFDNVPDELILAILELVPSHDLATAVQRVSRRFYRLSSEPKLWLARCRSDFVHWTASTRTRLKRAGRGSRGPWKQLWLDRMRGDAAAQRHFERVLASKVDRVHHLAAICRRGLDSKDFLLREFRSADDECHGESVEGQDTGDCLCRRYYASTALSSIHRGLAIEEWIKVRRQTNSYARLDRALAAFDMFVLHDRDEDMDRVQRILDDLAADFRREHALGRMTVREKADALVRWIRRRNLAGMPRPDINYRNLRNCLIGHALADEPDHPSLPIISSAIFACLGERLGLRAYCCAVPGHVHATILADPGESVDGVALPDGPSEVQAAWPLSTRNDGDDSDDSDENAEIDAGNAGDETLTWTASTVRLRSPLPDNGERMFLDPYNDDNEVALARLRASIAEIAWGVAWGATTPEDRDTSMLPTPTSAIVLRVALNIEASWTHAGQVANIPALSDEVKWLRPLRPGRHADPDMDLEGMLYASIWATVLMRPSNTPGWEHQLDSLLGRFAHMFSEDVWIIEKYLLPVYDSYVAQAGGEAANGLQPFQNHQHTRSWTDARVMIKMMYNLDRRQPLVSRRYTQDICAQVKYKVGQVFRHRRFGYIGIINGWSLDGPKSLLGPNDMSAAESWAISDDDNDNDNEGGGAGSSAGAPQRRRSNPTFYTCLRTGAEHQVIAQRNIEIVTDPDEVPPALLFSAGKNFKRFDRATCTFVSNLSEFYPDD